MPPESDAPGNEPNLELPSFGFGRKKKRDKKAEEPEAAEDVKTDEATESAPPAPPAPAAPSAPAAGAAAPPPSVPRAPAAPPAPARAPGAGPTPARPAARPPARPPSRPVTPPAASPASPPKLPPARPPATRPAVPPTEPPRVQATPAPPAPAAEPAGSAAPDEPTRVLETGPGVDPLDAAAAALDAPRKQRRSRSSSRSESRARRRAEKRAADEQEAEEKRRAVPDPGEALVAALPQIKAVYAAILTGALAGLAAVLMAIGASKGCEAVRDTESCGGGIGLLAIVAILAIEVAIGANLLKAWKISDPFSTSFLGVGVVATIAMLTFLDQLDSVWMLLVIPVMTAASFALSWWVTVRFIDEYEPGPRPPATTEDEDEPIGESAETSADQDEDSHA